RTLGAALPPGGRGDHPGRHDALHGRGRALRPRGVSVPHALAKRRHPQELRALPTVTPDGTRRLEIVGRNTTELLAWLQNQPAVREAPSSARRSTRWWRTPLPPRSWSTRAPPSEPRTPAWKTCS